MQFHMEKTRKIINSKPVLKPLKPLHQHLRRRSLWGDQGNNDYQEGKIGAINTLPKAEYFCKRQETETEVKFIVTNKTYQAGIRASDFYYFIEKVRAEEGFKE